MFRLKRLILSVLRRWALLFIAVTCVALHFAEFRTRFGVYELNGKQHYFHPLDRVQIDTLITADPGPHVSIVGFEYIKLYKTHLYPWHVRVSPIWTVLLPCFLLVVFLPRSKRSGVEEGSAAQPT